MNNLNLQCKCGAVQGVVENVTHKSGNRCICFCKDCQAFPTELGVANSVLDEHGGTELFQAPLSHVKITQGSEHLRCLRLTKKGLYRWYTDCCNTAVGNTVSTKIPFFGIVHSFMKDVMDRTELLGPIRGAVFIKNAKGGYVKNMKICFLAKAMYMSRVASNCNHFNPLYDNLVWYTCTLSVVHMYLGLMTLWTNDPLE